MRIYQVYGEHGPTANDVIEMKIVAPTKRAAVKAFIKYMKEECPIQWKRMGRKHVYAGLVYRSVP